MTSMEALSIGFWGTVGYVLGSLAVVSGIIILFFGGVFVYAVFEAVRHKKRDR